MKLRRRIGSVFLAFAMALSLIPSVAVSALAAGGDAEQYVTATFSDNSGNRDVTVKVVGPNGEDFGTHTYNDVGGGANTITLTLTDTADGQYDIESVENDSQSGNWHSITNETLSSNSYSCLYSSSNDLTLTVSLVPNYTEPDLPNGTIDNGTLTRVYRLYDDQILKMLHANDIQVSVETTIKSVKPTWVNSFGEDHRAFDDINLADADYWNLSVTGATADDVQPNNIRKLTITYDNGNGEETVDIYSGDLSYPIENDTAAGVTQHYNIELNNDTFHIVYFYDVTGVNTTVYSLYDIAFVNHNGIVDDEMPADPTYPNTRYEFVCWTETPDGGRPFLETTPVTKDTILYSQKALSTVESYSPYIYVMNDDNLFKTRLNELFGTSDIDLATVEVTVCGESGAQTNPDYEAGHLVDNGWSEDDEYYLVYNYQPGAEGSGQGNEPVHINDINKIIVTANKLNGDSLGQVEILKGIYDGEFWVSTGTWGSDMIINLYINDNGVENPDTPGPGTDPAITDFSKDLVDSAEAAQTAGITDTSTYTFPENGTVIIPYDEEVTLLYAITVTGEGGTEFTVTDEGATLVSNNAGVSGSDGTFTGTISDTGSITFYVSKTFGADDIVDGKLTNNANIISDDGVDEDNDDAEEETPAEEESYTVYTYVEFVGSGYNGALTDSDKEYIEATYNIETDDLDGGKYLPLGSFTAPLPDPEDEEYKPASDTENGKNVFNTAIWEKVKLYLNEETFVWVENDYKDVFDLSDLGWYQLCVANGALTIDSDVNGLCWHLDGKINVNVPNISVEKALTEIQRAGATISSTDITEGMPLEVGDVLTWTITVTNSGNKEATGLKLEDVLTAGNTEIMTGYTITAPDDVNQDSFTVPAASNGTNGEVEFTATYTVTADDKGLTLKNTATVSDGDGDTEDDPSGGTENPVAERTVEITKELTQVNGTEYTSGMVNVGDKLTYTITVENTGNVNLTNVPIADTLWEEETELTITVNDSETKALADSTGSCTILKGEELKPGDSVTITYTYEVQDTDAGKTIENTATVSNNDIDDGNGDTEEVTVANPAVDMTKVLASATRDGQPVYDSTTGSLENYKAQVGDVLSYTITVTNTGNTELTDVKVTDSMWVGTQYAIKVDGAENYAGADGFTIKNGIAAGGSVTITYTYIVQDSDVAAGEITNTAGVYLPDGDEPGEEPDDTDEVIVNMDEDAYTITITPADIVIYTGGTGYAGVLANEDGELVSGTTESGLPEPGYHIDLPDAVETWLKEQGVDMSVAADLANYLHFRYYDANGEMTRNWDLEDQGVYSMEGDTVTAYVYSLSTNTVEGEFKDTPVRLEFTNNGEIVTDDIVKMDENTASATYQMTIYDGGLDQSQIKAVFTAKDSEGNEKSITCNVTIGTGDLTVKSVADENPDTNAIVDSGDKVTADTPTAVADDGVDFYVNDSQVTVDSSRVGLLVDSVSNDETFNQNMENDAISEVTGVSDAQAQSYYLDLVDTDNGNAVVTPSDDVTIYWPMPEDADPNGEFYIVHYDEMDRATATTTPQSDPDILKVSKDGNHLTFTTDSFSPFVLVYEQKDSGGPVTPPVEDDDDDTPPPVNPNPPQLNTEDHYAYIVGYEDGTVRPEGDITRAEVATIFFRLLTDESRNEYWSQTNDYTDVAEGDWYNNAVSTLSKAGILNGYEDGSFQPNGNITRAEFATIAARFFEATYEGEDLFPDIKDHWARDYINQAAHAGIVNGYEDGTFRPQENITRAEAMTIVNRTLDRHPDADHFLADMITWPDNLETAWYYEQVQEATNSHEYIMKTDADKNPYEIWKEILPVRDWSDLENTWSEAHAG